jgi:DNA-binding transcriptional MerR regulator
MRVIRDGPKPSSSKRDRSLAFFNVMIALKRLGFTVEGIVELLERYPEGVAKKYEGRLQQEVERAYNKIDTDDGTSGSQVPVVPVIIPVPQPLDDVHAIFKKWLGNDYDTDVLDATLAAAAVERLTGDPLWLMVISGSGNAKTETVQAPAGAGATITSTITSEGALLSASPRQLASGHASGGLLLKLGNRGLLGIKDFTSILSMEQPCPSCAARDLRR